VPAFLVVRPSFFKNSFGCIFEKELYCKKNAAKVRKAEGTCMEEFGVALVFFAGKQRINGNYEKKWR
jgi:hypothetical protein